MSTFLSENSKANANIIRRSAAASQPKRIQKKRKKEKYNLIHALRSFGYIPFKKVTTTLQGSIWRCKRNSENVVIKVTSKRLHKQSVAVYNGKRYRINENIIREKSILKYLTNSNSKNDSNSVPESLTKFIDFMTDDVNYFLVMEDGGTDFFDFVGQIHEIIAANKLDICEWHIFVKKCFKQMVDFVDFTHSMNCCHFDLSLENMLINDVSVCTDDNDDGTGKLHFCFDSEIQTKFCDFGLSEIFIPNATSFLSSKFCGKPNYKSPENTARNGTFNAKSNDIFSLGVCLFMMVFGSTPWQRSADSDAQFRAIMNGNIDQLLIHWKREHYTDNDDNLMDLITIMLRYEHDRATLDDIKQHPWLK